jgi:hypothetical protein
MSALLNLGDKITAGNRADATFFYKKRVADDSGTLLTEAETDANNRELLAQKLFDKASIVYTAGGVKASKAYSVKGTDFTVTRAGVKNVIGRDGLLTEIPANTPATEFANGVLKGTLIEPARTNLALRSEEFDDGYWSKINSVTVTPNTSVAPDGMTTADTITTDGLAARWLQKVFIVADDSQTYTASSYFKKTTTETVFSGFSLRFAGGTAVRAEFLVNTNNGTTIARNLNTSGASVKVTDEGNYWRIVVTASNNSTGNINAIYEITPAVGTTSSWVSNIAGSVIAWGAQLETGSVATSYIRTTDTAITQPADVITATGVSDLIGQTEGFLAVECDLRALGAIRRILQISTQGTINETVVINVEDSNIIKYTLRTNNVERYSFNSDPITSGKFRLVHKYKSGSNTFFLNGLKIGENSVSFSFSNLMTQISLGVSESNTRFLNDHIPQALIGKTAISDAEAIAWSTL